MLYLAPQWLSGVCLAAFTLHYFTYLTLLYCFTLLYCYFTPLLRYCFTYFTALLYCFTLLLYFTAYIAPQWLLLVFRGGVRRGVVRHI